MRRRNKTYSTILAEEVIVNFKDKYKDEKKVIIKRCIEYIRNYFIQFDRNFNDKSIACLLSVSERDTKIIRTKFGLYNGGIILKNDDVARVFDLSPARIKSIIDIFNDMIKDDIYNKIDYIISELKNGNDDVFNERIVGICELGFRYLTYKWVRERCRFLSDFNKFTKDKVRRFKMIGPASYNEIVDKVYYFGGVFADEIESNCDEKVDVSSTSKSKIVLLKEIKQMILELQKQQESQILLEQIDLLQRKLNLLRSEIEPKK